jgi:hypothetical protein
VARERPALSLRGRIAIGNSEISIAGLGVMADIDLPEQCAKS